jgi:hypothetical protein
MTMKRMTSSSTEGLPGLLLRTGLCLRAAGLTLCPIVDDIHGASSVLAQVVVPRGNRR